MIATSALCSERNIRRTILAMSFVNSFLLDAVAEGGRGRSGVGDRGCCEGSESLAGHLLDSSGFGRT